MGDVHLQAFRKLKSNRSARPSHLVSRLPRSAGLPRLARAPSLILLAIRGQHRTMKYLALLATLAISVGAVACKKAAATTATVPVAISIFPTATQTVLPGGSITFSSTVSNTSNTTVNWEVNSNVGGDADTGTITTAG